MQFTALTILLIVTTLVSLNAMNNESLKDKLMFIPYRCKNSNENYRIFTHMFIHADFMHLIFNMMTLYYVGQVLEICFIGRYGLIKGEIFFVGMYLMGGLFATLIPYVRNYDNTLYRSLGASGAVAAILFGFIIWAPLSYVYPFGYEMRAWIFGIAYLAFEIIADKKGGTNIAHDAHIGGALFGIIFILIINIEKGKDILKLVF